MLQLQHTQSSYILQYTIQFTPAQNTTTQYSSQHHLICNVSCFHLVPYWGIFLLVKTLFLHSSQFVVCSTESQSSTFALKLIFRQHSLACLHGMESSSTVHWDLPCILNRSRINTQATHRLRCARRFNSSRCFPCFYIIGKGNLRVSPAVYV